jgi:hypothetical protein
VVEAGELDLNWHGEWYRMYLIEYMDVQEALFGLAFSF